MQRGTDKLLPVLMAQFSVFRKKASDAVGGSSCRLHNSFFEIIPVRIDLRAAFFNRKQVKSSWCEVFQLSWKLEGDLRDQG